MEVTYFEGLNGEKVLTIQVGRVVSQGTPDESVLRNVREFRQESDNSRSVLGDRDKEILSQTLEKVWEELGVRNYSLLAEKAKGEGKKEKSFRMASCQPIFVGWVWSLTSN